MSGQGCPVESLLRVTKLTVQSYAHNVSPHMHQFSFILFSRAMQGQN